MYLNLTTLEVQALRALIQREPNALPESLRKQLVPIPTLIETQLPDDDGDVRRALQCPWCQAISWDGDDEGIRVVDVAERWSSFGYDADSSRIHGEYSDDHDFETDRYECERCGREVALPTHITEN